jgi:predicted nucleotidyltransferase
MSVTNTIKVSPSKIQLAWLQPKVQATLEHYLSQLVANYGDKVESVTLYGSQARGEAEPDSDIDLFIVIYQDLPALRQALIELAWQVQFEHDVVISDIICSLNQLQQLQAGRFPYYQNIENEGVLLWKSASKPTLAFA